MEHRLGVAEPLKALNAALEIADFAVHILPAQDECAILHLGANRRDQLDIPLADAAIRARSDPPAMRCKSSS